MTRFLDKSAQIVGLMRPRWESRLTDRHRWSVRGSYVVYHLLDPRPGGH